MIPIDIIISNLSQEPIYRQIAAQIQNAILSRKLKDGDILPSIRFLAASLRVSVITTKRAYDELLKDGFIISVPGKGFFVSKQDSDIMQDNRIKQVQEQLEIAVNKARALGVSQSEVWAIIKLLYEEEA